MIEIKPIQGHQIEEAKQVIITTCLEIFTGMVSEEQLKLYDPMLDLVMVQSHYFDNNGMFLVLLDRYRVVGTGAIRRFNEEIGELKRMWFLKEYRGRGLGKEMAQMLLDFARSAAYKKIRLDTFSQEKQSQAIEFYKRLGFYCIERYNDSLCTVFMEKEL
ncbi:GNAT family N-acetyltransferase [Scytonema sp. UIC 10036]|uniref:GNAT family N-acetyltransferase n=1 Tax=Scytonema sp. UIC 10036 TaxID=2304196 RepID=UPI0012DA8151|nr:GNAT family N-acetyltransferase [Scytonema sp. UIC 10036]MUG95411.1 GNAT family N-acetyltransferase [Scytonema sp. UIC 10036]